MKKYVIIIMILAPSVFAELPFSVGLTHSNQGTDLYANVSVIGDGTLYKLPLRFGIGFVCKEFRLETSITYRYGRIEAGVWGAPFYQKKDPCGIMVGYAF